MKALKRGLSVGLAVASLFAAGHADAFCRTRTCDPSRERCQTDVNDCIVSGLALYWPTSCIGFSVQEDGSRRHRIDATQLEQVATAAFGRWLGADCGGGRRPELDVQSLGLVSCDRAEYNQDHGNANILMFREQDWPDDSGHALALTTLWFNPKTGAIHDVDIEINGTTREPVTLGNPKEGIDLASVLTHEIGHFLGLSHSEDPTSVMRPFYMPGSDDLRQLRADDVQGICSIYTPERPVQTTSCTPRHGFASDCRSKGVDDGCSIAAATPGRSGASPVVALGLAAAFGLALGRRRARRGPGNGR